MTTRITIRKPDDWHLHVRDGEMLKAVLPFTAAKFGRAILMPNLVPPVRTTADGKAYRERVVAALPAGSKFKPLITCYLTDDTDPDGVERGFRDGLFAAVKLYPAHATTNSAFGVTDYGKITRVLERMEKIGMPFLMHGEYVAPDVDIFDREAVFIDRLLSKWLKEFPGLRMTLEHLSSKDGVDFVAGAAPQLGGSITPYHMMLTRTDWLGHGLKPYMYVMPVIKTARDRARAARGRHLGPAVLFPRHRFRAASLRQESLGERHSGHVQCPGRHRELCGVFEEEGALDKLEAFAALNGPKHYRMPPNEDTITLEKASWTAPEEVKVSGPDERALIWRGGEAIAWRWLVDQAVLNRHPEVPARSAGLEGW